MAEDYELLIKNNQEELDRKKTEMSEIKDQFIIFSGAFVGQWFNSVTRNYVKEYADISIDLGKEKLENLKEEVMKLESEANTYANECLMHETLWWHQKENESLSYEFRANSPPEFLSRALRPALGRLGPILGKYGYVNIRTEGMREHPVWCEWDFQDERMTIEGRACYPFGIVWSDSMIESIKKYSELHQQALKILERIEILKKEMVREQAESLWGPA